jgi:hypothetical protein
MCSCVNSEQEATMTGLSCNYLRQGRGRRQTDLRSGGREHQQSFTTTTNLETSAWSYSLSFLLVTVRTVRYPEHT